MKMKIIIKYVKSEILYILALRVGSVTKTYVVTKKSGELIRWRELKIHVLYTVIHVIKLALMILRNGSKYFI
jgi:hypothetical protein